jgi:hypothetical protein
MLLIIIPIILFIVLSIYVYRAIKSAPLKYTDEKRFAEAIRYEERFSHAFENDLTKLSKQANKTFL